MKDMHDLVIERNKAVFASNKADQWVEALNKQTAWAEKLSNLTVPAALLKNINNVSKMKSLSGISESLDALRKVNEIVEISNNSQLSNLALFSENIKAFNTLPSTFSALTEANRLFEKPNSFLDLIELQNKYSIPKQYLDSISLINSRSNKLIKDIEASTLAIKQADLVNQISSLHFSLNNLSQHIAAASIVSKKWDLIREYQGITDQAVEISEGIINDQDATDIDIAKFQNLIKSILKFINRNKKTIGLTFGALSVIVNLISLYSFLFVDSATKEDIEIGNKNIVDSISKLFDDRDNKIIAEFNKVVNNAKQKTKEYRFCIRKCKLMFKPMDKTMQLCSIMPDLQVEVLQTNGEWLYISFINQTDSLIESGWVKKKCFSPKIKLN